MFRDSYLKRIAKVKAATGNNVVRFRLRDGSIFSIPKRQVMDVYLSCFRGEVSTRETEAVLNAVAVSPGEGRMYELCQMMQE
jgi:hypothetical protein